MAKIRKATNEEKLAYAATKPKPVYPLYGFIRVDGRDLPIEFPNEGRGEPNYEVMAPEGYHFHPDQLHTLLCTDQHDLYDRVRGTQLVPCGEGCKLRSQEVEQ